MTVAVIKSISSRAAGNGGKYKSNPTTRQHFKTVICGDSCSAETANFPTLVDKKNAPKKSSAR
jgi:hypothetical protein